MLFQLLRWNCLLRSLQENQCITMGMSTLHPAMRLHNNAFYQLWGHTLYTSIWYIHKWSMHWYDNVTYLHILNVFDFALYFTHLLIQQTFPFYTHPKTCSAPASNQCGSKKWSQEDNTQIAAELWFLKGSNIRLFKLLYKKKEMSEFSKTWWLFTAIQQVTSTLKIFLS